MREKIASIALALGLVLMLEVHLLPALLAGLLVHALIRSLARKFASPSMSHHRAKLVALPLIAAVVGAAAGAFIVMVIAFFHGKLGNLHSLLHHMAESSSPPVTGGAGNPGSR